MTEIAPLPSEYGLPDIKRVEEDNPHGTGWHVIESGDQGPNAHPFDRYYVRFAAAGSGRLTGHEVWADYFYLDDRWYLGAN